MSGVTSGLIGLDEEVEWKARHFGLWLLMRVRITAMNQPAYFQDKMIKGPFRSFQHDHHFEILPGSAQSGETLMIDQLNFTAPVPLLGGVVDALVLKNYLSRFLEKRNHALKSVAESDQWQKYL